MRRIYSAVASALVLAIALAGCTSGGVGKTGPDSGMGTPRMYAGFGNYTRTVTTNSPEAQQWFNQGMQLLYGFNHDEAIRSFREAARLDPDCAMAWWGVSYAYGLHINNPAMTDEQSKGGAEAAAKAIASLNNETPVEKAMVQAVAKRYQWPAPQDRKPLDVAYAAAMEQAHKQFPSDADVATLFAESLMNLQPWDYWTHDGKPKGRIYDIIAAIESAIAVEVNHPGANHLYIHAMEASLTPEKAVRAATRLGSLVPGSGHLVHMPSHIWIRVGRYPDAVDANAKAAAVDKAYFAIAPPPRFYSLYYVHNLHFLAYAAMFEGRYETAIKAARQLEREVPESFLKAFTKQADAITPVAVHVMVRFGKWEDILKEPAPADYRLMSRAARHYARTVAFAALGRTKEARAEMAEFDALAKTIDGSWVAGNNPAPVVLGLARKVMEAETLYREGKSDQAFVLLREAVNGEETLIYDEPPGWMQPVRHALGALLLKSGKPAEAEAVYRADLARHPGNGWSLLGLRQSLEAQNKTADAAKADAELKKVWARADVTPEASCYCATAK